MNFFVRYVMAPSKNDIYNQMSDYELQKLFLTCYSKDIYCEQVHKQNKWNGLVKNLESN